MDIVACLQVNVGNYVNNPPKKLVPEDELNDAVSNGYTDLWSLADYFGVTIDFMKKAVCFYTYGNLSTDLYF